VIDVSGKTIIDKGHLGDAQLQQMNYFVQGVVGTLDKP
jgi:hypothetical protein